MLETGAPESTDRPRLRRALRVAAFAAAAVGVILAVSGVQSALARNAAFSTAVQTGATVTGVERLNETTFVFDTPGGQRTATRNIYRIRNDYIPYKTGETLRVNYDPEPPHDLLWTGYYRPPHLRAFTQWMSAILGGVLTLLALGLVLPRGALLREWP